MSKAHMSELNRAIAKAIYHMNHIPGMNGLKVTRKGIAKSGTGVKPALTRTQQIAQILYDSDDMKKYMSNQS